MPLNRTNYKTMTCTVGQLIPLFLQQSIASTWTFNNQSTSWYLCTTVSNKADCQSDSLQSKQLQSRDLVMTLSLGGFIWLQGPSSLQMSSPGIKPPRGSGGPAASQQRLARPGADLPRPDPEGTGWPAAQECWLHLENGWNGSICGHIL